MSGPQRAFNDLKTETWRSHLLDEPRNRLLGSILIILLLGAIALLAPLGGTSTQVAVHGAYLPIVIAAYVFGFAGAVGSAVVAGLLVMLFGADAPALSLPVLFLGYLLVAAAAGWLLHIVEERRKRLIRAQVSTLRSFAVAVETEEEQAGEHCERVAQNARTLGEALGLPQPELEELYWAGLLHDIGKVTVPREILIKPGGLTLEEYLVMRRHARLGANLLSSIGAFRRVSEAVGAHHERWDGGGYPGGVKGTDIPLFGRILAVVDVFEALSSDRPYRRALSPELALHELRQNAGSQFDPSLVALYERLYLEGKIQVAPRAESEEEQPRLELNAIRQQYGEAS